MAFVSADHPPSRPFLNRVLLLLSKHIAFSWPSSIVAFNALHRACLNLPPPPHPPHQFQFPMDLNHQKPNAPSYDYDYDFLVRVSRFFLSSAGLRSTIMHTAPIVSIILYVAARAEHSRQSPISLSRLFAATAAALFIEWRHRCALKHRQLQSVDSRSLSLCTMHLPSTCSDFEKKKRHRHRIVFLIPPYLAKLFGLVMIHYDLNTHSSGYDYGTTHPPPSRPLAHLYYPRHNQPLGSIWFLNERLDAPCPTWTKIPQRTARPCPSQCAFPSIHGKDRLLYFVSTLFATHPYSLTFYPSIPVFDYSTRRQSRSHPPPFGPCFIRHWDENFDQAAFFISKRLWRQARPPAPSWSVCSSQASMFIVRLFFTIGADPRNCFSFCGLLFQSIVSFLPPLSPLHQTKSAKSH